MSTASVHDPGYNDRYSKVEGNPYDEVTRLRSSSSRHQPTPKILSSDQIFRAEEGETLGRPEKM